MADFSGIPSLGINAIVRPAPEAPPPAVPSIESGGKGSGLNGRMASDGRHPPFERFAQRNDKGRADPQQLAGPSPAFQASVLELELDLQNTIARVEAARGKREYDKANGAAPEAGSARDDTAPAGAGNAAPSREASQTELAPDALADAEATVDAHDGARGPAASDAGETGIAPAVPDTY